MHRFSVNSRFTMAITAVFAWFVSAGCDGNECEPSDFDNGYVCTEDGHSFQSCVFQDCFEPPCGEGFKIREGDCLSFAPTCVQWGPGTVVCIGEIIGTCDVAGFVSCEDPFTQIECSNDGHGGLALMRGVCAAGARCYEIGSDIARGCDPRY